MDHPRDGDETDGQDLAETFDEENITPDGRRIATSDLQPDVFDVTSFPEDADLDDVLQPDDDFDPDEMDEAEYEALVMGEEDLDAARTFRVDPGDLVRDEDLQPCDLEPDTLSDEDLVALGYADRPVPQAPDSTAEERLDEGLRESFPASDPLSIRPGSD